MDLTPGEDSAVQSVRRTGPLHKVQIELFDILNVVGSDPGYPNIGVVMHHFAGRADAQDIVDQVRTTNLSISFQIWCGIERVYLDWPWFL